MTLMPKDPQENNQGTELVKRKVSMPIICVTGELGVDSVTNSETRFSSIDNMTLIY